MIQRCFAAVLAVALGSVSLAGFSPTTAPVSPDGTRATVDLPTGQHMKNVGGSDGAGLCVFTSIEHAARWQCVNALDGFQRWMRSRPGGGWPEKVDDMIGAYARTQGVELPPYIQHTGGDEAFLELALHTDRMPCVTYAGRDDFYRGRIAHMVSLAHLDATRAAIVDNNRPGYWVWMTRAEFLSRWRDMQGGWAVVLLNPPPPPHLPGPQKIEATGCRCDECKCKDRDKCPNLCPVQVFGQTWGGGSCGNGRCLPIPPAPSVIPLPMPERLGPDPIGEPPSDAHEWGEIPGHGWGWRFKQAAPAPAAGAANDNFGVDCSRIHSHPTYSINGVAVSRADAHLALAGGSPLADDSDRWHLTAVGDPAFLQTFKGDVAALPAEVRGKLLVQTYGLSRWEVSAFGLPVGVNLRKPSPGRTAADVGSVPAGEYSSAKLTALLTAKDGPAPAPEPPPVKPDPVKPTPEPNQPAPVNPAPAPELPLWAIGLAALLYFLMRKR